MVDSHGMNECIASSLTEVEVLQLLDHLFIECGSLQKVHQVVVERRLRICWHVLLGPLRQINQEDSLLKMLAIFMPESLFTDILH